LFSRLDPGGKVTNHAGKLICNITKKRGEEHKSMKRMKRIRELGVDLPGAL
jgi:hypothetical protein